MSSTPPDRLIAGRYRLLRLLERTARSEIYLAELEGASGFRRRVVLKRLSSDLLDSEELTRFLDEAKISSRLHHAGIAGVIDFGIEAEVPFQVIELVDGRDLVAAAETSGCLPPPEVALHIAAEVAHALDYLHQARDELGRALKLVHRDVTPRNILASFSGDVKLADFGIARPSMRVLTRVGVALGTTAFMSPEQVRGEPLDRRSDLFALGCTLHWLLAGTSPLESADALKRMSEGERCTVDAGVPAAIRPILVRALELSPGDRPPSGASFAAECRASLAALGGAVDGRSGLAAWVGAERTEETARRRGLSHLLSFEAAETTEPTDPEQTRTPLMQGVRAGVTAATRWQTETVPTTTKRTRPTLFLTAAGLALVALLLLVVLFRARQPIPRALSSPPLAEQGALEPLTGSATHAPELAPGLPEVAAQPAPAQNAPRPPSEPHRAHALPAKSTAAAPSIAELDQRLLRALQARGLEAVDTEDAPSRAALWSAWRVARQSGAPNAAAAALSPLLAEVAQVELSPALLKHKLDRLSAELRAKKDTLRPEDLERLDRRYLDLRSTVTGVDARGAEDLARRILALRDAVERAAR